MSQNIDDTDERYIERTFELAREAAARGDNPYGSLLVLDDEIVMEASNREATDDDIAAHPELALARRAASELSAAECARATMYLKSGRWISNAQRMTKSTSSLKHSTFYM